MSNKQRDIIILLLFVLISIPTNSNTQSRKETTMSKNYYCEYCGHKFPNINTLTAATCSYHPNGSHKGKHKLYEGSEKSSYDCKYCGKKFKTIMQMRVPCFRHPEGMNKGGMRRRCMEVEGNGEINLQGSLYGV